MEAVEIFADIVGCGPAEEVQAIVGHVDRAQQWRCNRERIGSEKRKQSDRHRLTRNRPSRSSPETFLDMDAIVADGLERALEKVAIALPARASDEIDELAPAHRPIARRRDRLR